MRDIVLLYVAAASLAALVMCVYDKRAAKKGGRRISEKALFAVSLAGGAAGMLAGMLLVRHKTRHWYFMLFIPMMVAAHAVIIITLLF